MRFNLTLLFCVLVYTASGQFTNYRVKVISDSVGRVIGTLQKVTAEGVAVLDQHQQYRIIKSRNIIKVKVVKKGLNMGTAIAGGAAVGVGAGATIFFSDMGNTLTVGERIAGTALIGAAGVAGGLLTGGVAELLNLRVVLVIDGNEERFARNYKKLERYSRERYMTTTP